MSNVKRKTDDQNNKGDSSIDRHDALKADWNDKKFNIANFRLLAIAFAFKRKMGNSVVEFQQTTLTFPCVKSLY